VRKYVLPLIFFHTDFTCSFSEEFMQSTDKAALLELTEEIASIEAEIQQLKDTKEFGSQPGYTSHPSVLDALKTPSYVTYRLVVLQFPLVLKANRIFY